MSKALFPLIIETRVPSTSDTEAVGYRQGQEWFNAITGLKYICTNAVTGTWVASGASATIDWASVTSKPTTLSGYGITDAQPIDPDLTAIAALAGTSGFLKKTAANTWSLDTATYLTGNQSITLSGDATGSGTTAINVTLANSGVTAGSYNSATALRSITVDAKGRITSVGPATTITPDWSSITSKPTTLSGYGITDAQPLDGDLTAIAALGTTGYLKRTGANTWILDAGISDPDAAKLSVANAFANNQTIIGYVRINNAYGCYIGADGGYFGVGAYFEGASWLRVTANQGGAVIRNTNGQLEIWTGNAETAAIDTVITGFNRKFFIDGSGNVYIGDGAPTIAAKLTIKQSGDASNPATRLERYSNDSYLDIGYRTTTNSWQINSSYVSTGGYTPISFLTSDSVRAIITVNGCLVLGSNTVNEYGQFHIKGPRSGNTAGDIAKICGFFDSRSDTGDGLTITARRITTDALGDWSTQAFHLSREVDGTANGSKIIFGPGWLGFSTNSNDNTVRAILNAGGDFGIGVVPTSGKGRLQLPNGTTTTDGVAYGDNYVFRYTTGGIRQSGPSATDVVYSVLRSTGETGIIAAISGYTWVGSQSNHGVVLIVNNSPALTIANTKVFAFAGAGTIDIGNVASTNLLRMRGGAGSYFTIDASQGSGSEWGIGDAVGAANGTFVIYDITHARHIFTCDAAGNVAIPRPTSFSSTLGVTGATSLSTLGTSGLATLNSASVSTTLGVTGNTTLSTLTTTGVATLGGSSAPAANTFAGNKIWGVTNSTAAAAGQVGEVISVYTTGGPVNGSITNIASIILQAGVWAVSFCVQIVNTTGVNSGTVSSEIAFNSISNLSMIGNYADDYLVNTHLNVPTAVNLYQLIGSAPKIIQVTNSTTHYLNARVNAPTGSTITAYIKILAIRIR